MANFVAPLRIRIDLLLNSLEGSEREAEYRHAVAARDSLKLLHRMVSRMLDVSRLEQGLYSVDLQLVDVAQLARETAASLSEPDRQVEVRAAEKVLTAADPDRGRQALENLISNAVKHSPPEAPVIVDVALQRRAEGEFAVIEVTDRGPGIAPELLPHIFTKFVRAQSSGGLGLVLLFLALGIATAHGARSRSSPSSGSERGSGWSCR